MPKHDIKDYIEVSALSVGLVKLSARPIDRGFPEPQIPHYEEEEATMTTSTQATASVQSILRGSPAMARFHSRPRIAATRGVQNSDLDQPSSMTRPNSAVRAPIGIAFGPFSLFPAKFLLLESNRPVQLGSRALEILVVLVERPGELVSKKELMDRVWPGLFVEPANLSVHMSALRRTLRDGRDGNRFIINVPGRGYSFVAPVEVSEKVS
jgi:DNA-binding winged helix-turn-helix (wHTH) protein